MAARFLTALLCAGVLGSGAYAADTLTNELGMVFSRIPAGTFQMGTPDLTEALMEHPSPDQADITDETPAHQVTLTQPFLLAQTEVTQSQWLRVMENRPGPAEYWDDPNWKTLPVTGINWFMAKRFVAELSKMDRLFDYRLPSEAEWEYAARAGSGGLRPVASDELDEIAWFIHNSGDRPQPVGTRRPNPHGLFDMFGNVWEWLEDVYVRDIYRQPDRVDPVGAGASGLRTRRGGSYHCPPHMLRLGLRSADRPSSRYSVLGFRVVAVPK